jgi:long-chain acyl-CoA synthetase
VVDLVHRTVERDPEHEAIRWKTPSGWASWTYEELWQQVAATSGGLRRMGVGAGDRVILLSRSRPEWVVTDLAIMALGAATCPIYHAEPPARMGEIAHRLGARLAVVEDVKLRQRLLSGIAGAEPAPHIVLIDPTGAGDDEPSLAGAVGGAAPDPDDLAAWKARWRTIHEDQVATIVHTIGVDGEPLGVVVSHGNLLHSIEASAQAVPVSADDVLLSVLPLSHLFERGACMLTALGVGATIAFAEHPVERWAVNMAEVRPTVMASIPLFFERIEDRIRAEAEAGPAYRRAPFTWATRLGERRYANHLAGRTDGWWLRLRYGVAGRIVLRPIRAAFGGRLRFFISGGAALPATTGLFFESMGLTILEGYGLTESAPGLTVNRVDTYRYGTVGPPLAGTELRIDPATGEILARGKQIMLGYLDRPSDTARAVDAEGWLRTGDVGELDEEGRLRITGRIKNLLVLATGKNVAPAPIEQALARSPYIAQAVALGDDRESVGALLVPNVAALRGRVPGAGADESDAAFLARPEAAELLAAEVERLTAEFAAYERPRTTALLPRPLSADAGEVDATGLPVRSVVMAAFPEQVTQLFERGAVGRAVARRRRMNGGR